VIRRSAPGFIAGLLAIAACNSVPTTPADDVVWRACASKDGVRMLDGQSFVCRMSDGAPPPTQESVVEFHGGRFHAASCDAQTYSTAAYFAMERGGAVEFTATTTNARAERIDWRGSVTGDVIRGSASCRAPNQPAVDYTFEGTRARP
jgi:hypothetical protein